MELFRRTPHLTPDQRGRLARVLGPLDRYAADERESLADLAAWLLARPDWTPARGFEVTEEMRFVVAATAAVLGVGTPDADPFGNVGSVVLHPTTMVDRRPRPTPVRGVVTEAPRSLLGHTTAHGPVFVSWRAVERDRRHGRGSVVLHEFAHKLDAADAVMDGTPRLHGRELRRWVDVCTRVFEDLSSGRRDPVLRPYAATNPTEFFAVTTEAFFTRPLDLRHVHPDLYEVFAASFGQDPAAVDTDRGLSSMFDEPDPPAEPTGPTGPTEPAEPDQHDAP